MDKKVKILLVAIGIALLVAIAATSYAFFTISNKEGNVTNITSATMGIEYDDGDEIIANYLIPGDHVDKTFRVRNTGSYPLKYDVFLDEVYNNFVDQTDLVYELISNDGGYNTSSQIQAPNATTKIVDGQALPISTTHTYTLRITFLNKTENQDDNQGKSFRAKIRINTYQDTTNNGGGNSIPTISSCPGCKYIYHEESVEPYYDEEEDLETFIYDDRLEYGLNATPLTDEQYNNLKENYLDVVNETGRNYFLGLNVNESTHIIEKAYVCGIEGDIPICIEAKKDEIMYNNLPNELIPIYGEADIEDDDMEGCYLYDIDSYISCWHNQGDVDFMIYKNGTAEVYSQSLGQNYGCIATYNYEYISQVYCRKK